MITFNTLQAWPKVNQYARLLTEEYKREVMERHYKHKERTGTIPTYRGHDAYTQVINTMYWKAGQDLEPHVQHIQGNDRYSNGHRHILIQIPYFEHIPNANGTPGSKHIWVTISPYEGMYLYMTAPTGERVYHRPRGNRPATWDNIQHEAQALFLRHYLPDTIPAATFQCRYGITKSQAVKAWLTANRTGWYKTWSHERYNHETGRYEKTFECISTPPPAVDPERATLRRLERKYKMKVMIDPMDITPALLKRLLNMEPQKHMTEVHRPPSLWALMEEAEMEEDTDEGLENYVNQHFNQYPKTAILI